MLMGGGRIGAGSGGSGGGHRDPAREERHRARDEQLEVALAANPEAFVSVPMLYVQCTLNDVRALASPQIFDQARRPRQPCAVR